MATDLSLMTRDLFLRTIVEQQFYDSLIMGLMYDNKSVTWGGGENIEFLVNYDSQAGTSLVQAYDENDPLESGKVYRHKQVEFDYSAWTIPIEYSRNEALLNQSASNESKLHDIVKNRVSDTHTDLRQYMIGRAYNTGSTEGDAHINSILLALTHDATYGGLTRADSTTNSWWQGASLGNNWTDQSTARTMGIDLIRDCVDKVSAYRDPSQQRIVAITGNDNYRKLLREIEGSTIITGQGGMAKYGHTSVQIDNQIEVMPDKWLTNESRENELLVLDVNTWEYRMHQDRNFKMTPFEWGGKVNGGLDKYLARILCMGQLFCRQPNANIYLDSVS